MYASVLNGLLEEIGAERLAETVKNCIASEQFISVAALRDYIPSLPTVFWERKEEPKCSYCGDNKFLSVAMEGKQLKKAIMAYGEDAAANMRVAQRCPWCHSKPEVA